MQHDPRILACVDQSHFADTVADYAVWASLRLDAPLEFLHVIDREPEHAVSSDHSGTIGIDAQQNLLSTLVDQDAARTRASREQGRIFLNRLRERAIAAGAPAPDVRQRHGGVEETLVEHEPVTRLFVIGRRGASAEITQRDLGRNVERVIRSLRRPILAVTEDYRQPSRVLVAFDGSDVTRRAVAHVAKSPLLRGLPMHVLTAGVGGAAMQRRLEWAQETLVAAGFDVSTAHTPGDPERVIAEAVQRLGIDLVVMGAYGHSRLRSLLFGSRTNGLLRASVVPTLLLR